MLFLLLVFFGTIGVVKYQCSRRGVEFDLVSGVILGFAITPCVFMLLMVTQLTLLGDYQTHEEFDLDPLSEEVYVETGYVGGVEDPFGDPMFRYSVDGGEFLKKAEGVRVVYADGSPRVRWVSWAAARSPWWLFPTLESGRTELLLPEGSLDGSFSKEFP